MVPPLLLLLACSPAPTAPAGSSGGSDTGAPDDAPGPAALIEVSREYAHLGLELRTYELQEGYTDLEGLLPRFYVFVPVDLAPGSGPVPTLVWLHGGVGAVPEDPNFGQMCTQAGTEGLAKGSLPSNRWLSTWLAREQWVAVVPHSPWCDMWSGLGPDDPVSEDQRSIQHAETSLRLLGDGLDGVQADLDAVSVWGVSAGGVGSLVVARHLADVGVGLQGVVADSGPWDLIGAHSAAGGSNDDLPDAWLEAWFGGPPVDEDGADTEWRQNYARVDGPSILVGPDLPVPVLAAWNRWDLLSPRHSGEELARAAETARAAGGPPHLVLDTDRKGPGETNHVQLSSGQLVRIWGPVAGTDAAQGRALHYAEADDACVDAGCDLRVEVEPDGTHEALVSEDGLLATPDDGAVALAALPWPAEVPTDRPVRLRLAADLPEALPDGVDASDVLVEVLLDGAVVHAVRADQVVTGPQTTDADLMHTHVAAFTVELSADDVAAAPTVGLQVTGRATLRLDGLWWSWVP